jgi:hypothetical protein
MVEYSVDHDGHSREHARYTDGDREGAPGLLPRRRAKAPIVLVVVQTSFSGPLDALHCCPDGLRVVLEP